MRRTLKNGLFVSGAACMLLAAGCSGPSISPEEPDGNGNIEEYLESNIIYNRNLSL